MPGNAFPRRNFGKYEKIDPKNALFIIQILKNDPKHPHLFPPTVSTALASLNSSIFFLLVYFLCKSINCVGLRVRKIISDQLPQLCHTHSGKPLFRVGPQAPSYLKKLKNFKSWKFLLLWIQMMKNLSIPPLDFGFYACGTTLPTFLGRDPKFLP